MVNTYNIHKSKWYTLPQIFHVIAWQRGLEAIAYMPHYHVAAPRQQGNRSSGSATTSLIKGCHIDSPDVASDGKVAAPMTLCQGK